MMKVFSGLSLMTLSHALLYNVSSSNSANDSRLVNFLWLISARISNSQQKSDDIQNHEAKVHTQLSAIYKPVKMPAFPSSITIFLKESVNNKLYRQMIFVVSLDPDGVIRMKPYSFVNMEKYTLETPESEVISGELQEQRKDCDVTYVEIEPNVFFGTYPDCLTYVNTTPQSFTVAVTCNGFSGFSPSGAQESINPRPYIASVVGERFSLSPFSNILGEVSHIKDPCSCY